MQWVFEQASNIGSFLQLLVVLFTILLLFDVVYDHFYMRRKK